MATLVDALPPGSYLVASATALDHAPGPVAAMGRAAQAGGIRTQQRDSGDFARIAFSGLELVPPGVVPVSEWRPGSSTLQPDPAEVNVYGGVARKP